MERDELLIEAVRDYPCLYNSKSADFKVLLKKENAWTAIAARLERTVEDCQKRWKVLRERFVKELRKKKKKSGDGATASVPWELQNQMEFLREFVKHRKSEGNMVVPLEVTDDQPQEELNVVDENPNDLQNDGDDSMVQSGSTSSSSASVLLTPRPRKRVKRALSPDDLDREILKQLQKDVDATTEKDEDDLFGQSIGASLKKMAPQQKALAKMKIQQLLYEIQFNVQPSPVQPSPYYPPSETPMY